MSLPALHALREQFPAAHIAVLARPWVADLYGRESFCSEIIPYNCARGARDLDEKWKLAGRLRSLKFDWAILLQNAFEAAAIVRLAGISRRIGYNRDGRGFLLTDAVPVPAKGEIPAHERFYYLELLRRAGILSTLPSSEAIRLEGANQARTAGLRRFEELGINRAVIGVSPGAAYGTAKRWLPEHFAEAALRLSRELNTAIAVFGSLDESELCERVRSLIAAEGGEAHNFGGATSLRQFIEMAAACQVFLTNDSGAMHIASALGVPTVAVFGATDHIGTGPTGPLASIVREQVDCSPCLLRVCPIDHRCMTRVSAERVANVALGLLRRSV
jgi:heptosyltransferase-2